MSTTITTKLKHHFMRTLPYMKDTAIECMRALPIYDITYNDDNTKYWVWVKKQDSNKSVEYDYNILKEEADKKSVCTISMIWFNVSYVNVRPLKKGNTPQLEFTLSGNRIAFMRNVRFSISSEISMFKTKGHAKFILNTVTYNSEDDTTTGTINFSSCFTNDIWQCFDDLDVSDIKLYTDYGNIASGFNGIKTFEDIKKFKIKSTGDIKLDYKGEDEDGIMLLFSKSGNFNFTILEDNVVVYDAITKKRAFIYFDQRIEATKDDMMINKLVEATTNDDPSTILNFQDITVREDNNRTMLFRTNSILSQTGYKIAMVTIMAYIRTDLSEYTANSEAEGYKVFGQPVENILKFFPITINNDVANTIIANEIQPSDDMKKRGYRCYRMITEIPILSNYIEDGLFDEASEITAFETKFKESVYV